MASAVAELLSDPAAAQQTAEAFQRLKPVCSQLLYCRTDPQLLLQCLKDLHTALADVSSRGLARCYDYITYPLLFMIDCIAVTRTQPAGSNGTSSGADGIAIPAVKNDRVAEAVLNCMLLLLERVGSSLESDQVLILLQRLVAVLQLTPQQATEEIRLKSLNTLAAALQPPGPRQQQQQPPSPLSQPSTAPLTGVIITQCLAAAAAEVSAGSSGSRAVVQAAIRALQAVVTAVGPGAGLSFFLPGLASGLTKLLLAAAPAASGPPATGAAAGSSTVVLVLQLLTQVINMTLGDDALQHVPPPDSTQQQTRQQVPAEDSSSSVNNVHEALGMLEQLAMQAAADHSTNPHQQQQQQTHEQPESSRHSPREGQPVQQQQQQRDTHKEFTVQQTPEWLVSSSSKVQDLLAMTLPRLLAHPQPAVRAAVAAVAADLLQQCNRSLQNSKHALLEILLTLATDDYDQVSHVAVGYLQQAGAAVEHSSSTAGAAAAANGQTSPTAAAAATAHSPMSKSAAARRIAAAARQASAAGGACISAPAVAANSSSSSSGLPGDLALTLCMKVAAAVRQSCAAGTAAAKRAAAALLCTSPLMLSLNIFTKSHAISQLCEALTATFQLDPSTAALLLRATAAARGGDVVSGTAAAAAAAGSHGDTTTAAAAAATAAAANSRVASPVLPRMPLSLKYLISADSYRAAAAVARAVGRCARVVDNTQQQQQQQAGRQGGALQLLVDHLLGLMRTAATPHRQQQQHQASGSSSSNKQLAAFPGAGEWQCQTAAVAIVITEIIFGASASWQAPIKQVGSSATTGSSMKLQQPVSDMDSCYESVLLSVTSAVTAPKLWGLPTSNSGMLDTAGAGGSEQQLPAQVLGANALLLHVLIDCVGTAARCAGQHFSSNTKLLRAALLPLLERMADPCPLVAAAAAGALDSICQHSGYPLGVSQLVGDNADYIVDGVCKKLRNLPAHPRSPQLLSVLLRHAGVGQQIIPLMAEPLRAALSGVSILARKQQPGYTLPFLHVLQSVAAGAAVEAAASQQFFKHKLADVVAAATAAGLFDTQDDDPDDEEPGGVYDSVGPDHAPAAAGGDSAAARYFRKHLEQKAAADTQPQQQQQQQSRLKDSGPSMSKQSAEVATSPPAAAAAAAGAAAVEIDLDSFPALPPGKKVILAPGDLEDMELAWRRAHSAASLASAAVEAATPLVLQRNLRLAVLAVSVLTVALEALAAATDAIDTEERMFDLLIDRPRDAALKPARPAAVKLLPAVHGIWPLLLACLQDTGSVSLIEQGLQLLSHMVKLAGGRFMVRRFKQEAWPLLVRLLQQGPQAGATALAAATSVSSTGGGAAAAALLGIGAGPGSELTSSSGRSSGSSSNGSGGLGIMQTALRTLGASATVGDTSWNAAQGSMVSSESYSQETEGLAPATLQRVRLAVLKCLQEICSNSSAAFAVQGPLVWELCVLTVPYLADSQALAMREAVGKLLVSAAQVDADTVWLVLVDLASCYTDISQLLAQSGRAEVGKDGGTHSKGEPAAPEPTADPTATAAAETLTRAAAGSASKGDQVVLPKLQQLLPRVSAAAGPAGSESGGLQKLLRSSEGVSCGKRAAALLQLIVKQQSHGGWPAKAEQQLEQLRLGKVL